MCLHPFRLYPLFSNDALFLLCVIYNLVVVMGVVPTAVDVVFAVLVVAMGDDSIQMNHSKSPLCTEAPNSSRTRRKSASQIPLKNSISRLLTLYQVIWFVINDNPK